MKFATALSLLGLGLGVLGFTLSQQACSSDSTSGGGASTLGRPPARPAGAAQTTSTTGHTFAMHTLLLGDTDRSTPPNASTNAWKKYGYNIDGLNTVRVDGKMPDDVCTPQA